MKTKKVDYLSYIICYALCVVLSKAGYSYPAGVVLMGEALFLYVLSVKRSGVLTDLRGLFSASWIGGEGLACLQLSRLQQDWENTTWLCFFFGYLFFMAGYDLLEQRFADGNGADGKGKQQQLPHAEKTDWKRDQGKSRRILICIGALMFGSIACFLLEAAVVGFIPLFSPEPHAYSYFHVSGVHYFTISCILIPALSVLYFRLVEKWNPAGLILLICGNVTAVGIPILCVSRFQLLFAVGFAAVVYLMVYRHVTWKMIVMGIVILIPVYVLLTVARRHDVTYLNSIFEMKYSEMPIFVTQPYMYVVNNYENFNCMVAQLPEFTHGLKMLFPVFALTGLKFVFPQLVAFPLYTTKPELTTLTIFYDAYYDFGTAGVVLFALVLGGGAFLLTRWTKKSENPLVYLFYGQIAIYLGLSFFTTWFSNPTTWFWLALTMMMYAGISWRKKTDGKKLKRIRRGSSNEKESD